MIDNNKHLYIVFSATCTKIGSMIRFFTRNKYSHVSISFDEDLKKMYSFTRYHANTPFIAGFTEESPLRYCSNSDEQTFVKIFSIPIDDDIYDEMLSYFDVLKRNSDRYLYNYLSALVFLTGFKLSIPQAYTCIEFAVHILSRFKLIEIIDDKRFYNISDLEYMLDDYCNFEGNISEIARPEGWGDDIYESRAKGKVKICTHSARRIGKLFYRLVETQ